MNGCNRDVGGIGGGPARNSARGQEGCRQFRDLDRDVQQWQGLQDFQPFARCRGVSCARFVEDKLRDVDLEITLPLLPPVSVTC